MNWKPTPWIAGLLGLLFGPIGLLYARRPLAASGFLVAVLVAGLAGLTGYTQGIERPLTYAFGIAGAIVAFSCAMSAKEGPKPWYSRWYGLAGIALIAVGGTMAVRTYLYEPFAIPSSAMEPTLMRKSHILVEKRPGALHRGEIVVFDYPRDPNSTYVKRVIGLPGDRITYRDKHVLVNGQETRVRRLGDFLDEERLGYMQRYLNTLDGVSFDTLVNEAMPADPPTAWTFPMGQACARSSEQVDCVVPTGHYFVMGDNRDNSHDSRYWGFLRSDLVKGRVVKIFQ